MARINLIAWDNQRGLSHDIQLLRAALEAIGHQVHQTRGGPRRHHGKWKARWSRLTWWLAGNHASRRYDVNIFLEHVRPACLGLARRNVLIPNPEWFSGRDQRWLDRFDAVFTKTHVASETFLAWGCATTYIGFASVDRYQPETVRAPGFLHLAGASRMKGTERLLALWRRHPEWPCLHVLQSAATADAGAAPMPPNIDHRCGYVRDIADITQLQNTYAHHLCLSETEGWGHYLVEPMGCAAIVVTCDAAPMNELVRPDRGVLVAAHEAGRLNAAVRHHFDDTALEAAIERLITMPAQESAQLQANARAWFLSNNDGFRDRLEAALTPLL